MKQLKRIYNYIPLLGVLLVGLCSYVFLNYLVTFNEIAYFAIILGIPIVTNAVAMYQNYTELKGNGFRMSALFTVLLQSIPVLIFGVLSDDKGKMIFWAYLVYVVVINVILWFLMLAITDNKKLSAKQIKFLYSIIIIISYCVFFAGFIWICY